MMREGPEIQGHPSLELLVDYLEGRLSSAGSAELERHLRDGCASCQADLAQFSAALDLLRAEAWLTPPAASAAAARALYRRRSQPAAPRAFPRLSFGRLTWAAAAAFAVFIIGVVGLLITTLNRPAAGIVARSGGAMVLPAGEEAWQPAGDRQTLAQGDVVRTNGDANLLLALYGRSQVSLAPYSEVELVELQPSGDVTVLRQAYGVTQHVVEPLIAPDARYEVRTPSSVITVIGTTFQVEVARDGTTTVTTAAGEVHVAAQGSTVQVAAGWSVTVRPGRGPAQLVDTPKPLPTLWFPANAPGLGAPTVTPTLAASPTLRATLTIAPPGDDLPNVPPADTPVPAPPSGDGDPEPVKTKQTPPGQTKTPQPPGQTRTPWPPPTQDGVPPGQGQPPR